MSPTLKNPIKDVLIGRIRLGTNPSKFNLFSTKAYTLTRFLCVPKFSKVCLQISICFGLNEKKVAIKRTMRRSTQPDLASLVIQALLYSVYDKKSRHKIRLKKKYATDENKFCAI